MNVQIIVERLGANLDHLEGVSWRVYHNLDHIFNLIIPDEAFHARSLRNLAGREAMMLLKLQHEAGLKAIGIRKGS